MQLLSSLKGLIAKPWCVLYVEPSALEQVYVMMYSHCKGAVCGSEGSVASVRQPDFHM